MPVSVASGLLVLGGVYADLPNSVALVRWVISSGMHQVFHRKSYVSKLGRLRFAPSCATLPMFGKIIGPERSQADVALLPSQASMSSQMSIQVFFPCESPRTLLAYKVACFSLVNLRDMSSQRGQSTESFQTAGPSTFDRASHDAMLRSKRTANYNRRARASTEAASAGLQRLLMM